MTLKKYLIYMALATLFCAIAWFEVLFFVNPLSTGPIGFVLFYLSLFLTLWGIFSIIGFLARYIFKKNEFAYNHVKTSFRQGFLFSLLLAGSSFLQSYKLLVWWNLLLLIGLLAIVEYFFTFSTYKNQVPPMSS
ncbi:MAG: hypothetical protein ABIJ91_05010 [Candidatus Kuenenbacteria bacterium]